jgi:hypothetical protein
MSGGTEDNNEKPHDSPVLRPRFEMGISRIQV